MKRLDRYIIAEIAILFVAAQAVFVVLFIGTEALNDATKLISRYGFDAVAVIKLLLLRIPWAIGWTMPMSTGMAVVIALGRLSRENEYTAAVVGGMSFPRIMVPAIAFALAVCGLALVVEEYAGPAGMMAYHRGKQVLQTQSEAVLREVHLRLTPFDDPRRVTLTAGELDLRNSTMGDVQVELSEHNREVFRVRAASARFVPETKQWVLRDGFYQWRSPDWVTPVDFTTSTVEELAESAGIGGGIGFEQSPDSIAVNATVKPDYLTFWEIRRRIRDMTAQGQSPREINRVKVYLYQRWTLAFSCVVFVLVGAPLAIRPERSPNMGGAFATGVGLCLTYYILWNSTSRLAEGVTMPWLWAWSTNIAGAILGLALWRTVRD